MLVPADPPRLPKDGRRRARVVPGAPERSIGPSLAYMRRASQSSPVFWSWRHFTFDGCGIEGVRFGAYTRQTAIAWMVAPATEPVPADLRKNAVQLEPAVLASTASTKAFTNCSPVPMVWKPQLTSRSRGRSSTLGFSAQRGQTRGRVAWHQPGGAALRCAPRDSPR